ncbi:STAS/SEC14 domain-containing protein [candidate division WOR-3 bacterium]|nr:STAS/SEC14 domain-containing protein [candidate division WOR-3 bacterium]
MNYELRFDKECSAVYLKVITMLTDKDVHEMMPEAEKMFDNMLEGKKHVLVDTSPDPPGILDKPARKAFRKYVQMMKVIDKIAIYGAKPIVRMMARAAAAALGKLNATKFFAGKEDAVRWLKGDA